MMKICDVIGETHKAYYIPGNPLYAQKHPAIAAAENTKTF